MTEKFLDSDRTPIEFNSKGQNIYFTARSLKPRTNTTITVNDVNIDRFAIPRDVIQIQFDNKFLSSSVDRFRGYLAPFSSYLIADSGRANKYISSGRYGVSGTPGVIEIVSFDSANGTGVANVHVFHDDSVTLSSSFKRVRTANTTFLELPGISSNNRIISFIPRFSQVVYATSNTITLSEKVANSEIANASSGHYIVGKKIYIVSGRGAGQNAVVQSYNTTTRTITTTTNFNVVPGYWYGVSNDENYIERSERDSEVSVVRLGELYSDTNGTLTGLLMAPAYKNYNTSYSWFSNNFRNSLRSSRNKFEFQSLDFTKTTVTDIQTDTDLTTAIPRNNVDTSGGTTLTPTTTTPTTFSVTPFAQTFIVDNKLHPQGISLTSVRLLLRSKDATVPLQVQIRPTTASIPDASAVMPNGNAFINPYDIKLLSEDNLKVLNASGENPFSNTANYSEAIFEKPVFLEPGKEYALVILSASTKHELYISQIGQKLLGTERIISAQPYTGVLYKSQGTSSWTPSVNEDLAFELMKARYSTTTPATIDFYLQTTPANTANYGLPGIVSLESTAPQGNTNVHAFYIESPANILPNTKIEYQFKTIRYDGTNEEFRKVELDDTYEFDDNFGSRVLTSSNNSFIVRAAAYTTNPDIAPAIDFTKLRMVKVENIIDNGSIANSNFFVTNLGEGYSNSQNVIVTIQGGGGSGATARANVQNGKVISLEIVNGGSGYTGSPNVIISRDTTATVNAQAIIIGEDQPNGGVSSAKYITKKFSLADGFTAGDLRVLFSAVKPRGCELDVYYKVLSEDDLDAFENKKWTMMTVIGGINAYSAGGNDFKKYIYAPGKGNLPDNFINYDGFTNFKYFAVKIVMRSIDPIIVPKIKELRIVALAELLS